MLMSATAVSTRTWSGMSPVLSLSTASLKTSSWTETTEDREASEEVEDNELSDPENVLSMYMCPSDILRLLFKFGESQRWAWSQSYPVVRVFQNVAISDHDIYLLHSRRLIPLSTISYPKSNDSTSNSYVVTLSNLTGPSPTTTYITNSSSLPPITTAHHPRTRESKWPPYHKLKKPLRRLRPAT